MSETIKLEFSESAANKHGSFIASVPDTNGGRKEIEYTNMAQLDSDGYKWEDKVIQWTGARIDAKWVRQGRTGSEITKGFK